jgi:hypothetical protein
MGRHGDSYQKNLSKVDWYKWNETMWNMGQYNKCPTRNRLQQKPIKQSAPNSPWIGVNTAVSRIPPEQKSTYKVPRIHPEQKLI